MNIATTRGTARSSLSLPNILTYARIAAVPVVVGCIYAQSIMDGPLWLRWVAVAVFIAAGVTDYLDGYYARIWNQQSAFGRMLDPIADKLLVSSCLLILAADGIIHGWSLWAAIVILCREILVSGLREYLAELRVEPAEGLLLAGRDPALVEDELPHSGQFQPPLSPWELGKAKIRMKAKAHRHRVVEARDKHRLQNQAIGAKRYCQLKPVPERKDREQLVTGPVEPSHEAVSPRFH